MGIRRGLEVFRGYRVPHLRIIEHRRWWFMLSGFFVLVSVIGLLVRGLTLSIDFEGGALIKYPDRSGATVAEVRGVLAKYGRGDAEIQIVNGNEVSIRTGTLSAQGLGGTPSTTPAASPTRAASPSPALQSPTVAGKARTPSITPAASPSPTPESVPVPETQRTPMLADLAKQAGISVNEISITDVGPTWGAQISSKALKGLVIFLVLVTVYIAFRFEWKMAVSAQTALIHDIIITVGIYALVGREVTPATVIAFLTILGYSLYDTVVIFDKVKENTESAALVARDTYAGVVNMSLNQTLMRSVNTSLVVLLPIASLLLFGGDTLKDFAFALFIGVTSGTYSSIFVASPVLVVLKERERKYRQLRDRREGRAINGSKDRVSRAASKSAARARKRSPELSEEELARELEAAGVVKPARAQPSSAPRAKTGGKGSGGSKKRTTAKQRRRR